MALSIQPTVFISTETSFSDIFKTAYVPFLPIEPGLTSSTPSTVLLQVECVCPKSAMSQPFAFAVCTSLSVPVLTD